MSLDEQTAAERDFFASRGRSTDALLAENKDGVQRITDETPVQSVPDAGADPQQGGPQSAPVVADSSPAPTNVDTKSAPAPIEEEDEPPLDPQKPPPQRVRYRTFLAEKERREALEKELRELEKREAATNERLRLFNEALRDDQPQQVEEDPQPDPMQDAYAYMQWQDRQRERLAAELREYQQNQNQRSTEQQIIETYRNDAARFAAQQPLFQAAYYYVRKNRMDQLANMEPWTTPEQRAQTVLQEEFSGVRSALEHGLSPAERFFNLARQWGFDHWYAQEQAKQQAQQNNQSPSPGGGNGAGTNGVGGTSSPPPAQAVPAPANPQALSAVQQVQAIARNQAASQSLSNGGGAPLQNMDSRALATMTDEEFEVVFNRLQNSRNKPELRRLMGG